MPEHDTTIPIRDIDFGERRREDYGDLAALGESIVRYGLMHPPVVDASNRLIAGGRRVKACESIGWTVIPITRFGDLSEAERREIELEENLRRKDLTPFELARTFKQRAILAAEILREEASVSDSIQNPNGGRPAKPDNLRSVASHIGSEPMAIVRADHHVETAEQFPFMQKPDWKQYHVLEAREAIEQLPEPERPKAAALIDKPATPPKVAIKMLRNVAAMPAPKREEVFRLDQSDDMRDRSLALTTAFETPPMPDPRLTRIERAIRELQEAITPFPNDPETPMLQNVIATLRSVKAMIRKAA